MVTQEICSERFSDYPPGNASAMTVYNHNISVVHRCSPVSALLHLREYRLYPLIALFALHKYADKSAVKCLTIPVLLFPYIKHVRAVARIFTTCPLYGFIHCRTPRHKCLFGGVDVYMYCVHSGTPPNHTKSTKPSSHHTVYVCVCALLARINYNLESLYSDIGGGGGHAQSRRCGPHAAEHRIRTQPASSTTAVGAATGLRDVCAPEPADACWPHRVRNRHPSHPALRHARVCKMF